MRTSCISHPPNHPLVLIRKWQVEFCDGDVCAAALLSYFEYWHNIKLSQREKAKRSNDIADMHGDDRMQDESLIQFHSEENLVDGIMHIYAKNSIAKAINLLAEKGAITVMRNPNPKYVFDKTRHFLFHPEVCIAWLKKNYSYEDEENNAEKEPAQTAQTKNNGRNPKSSPEDYINAHKIYERWNAKKQELDDIIICTESFNGIKHRLKGAINKRNPDDICIAIDNYVSAIKAGYKARYSLIEFLYKIDKFMPQNFKASDYNYYNNNGNKGAVAKPVAVSVSGAGKYANIKIEKWNQTEEGM